MKKLLMFLIITAVLYPLKASAQYNQQDIALTPDTVQPPVPPSFQWQAGPSVTYASGDFGTNNRADTVYVPVKISRYFSQASVDWTIPYVYKRNASDITFIDGRPFRTNQEKRSSANGLGDMLLKGNYYALQEDSKPLTLTLSGQIEIPTADDNKGLGTGEFDETIGAQLSKTEKNWKVFADIYYTNTGSPSGEDLKNLLTFDVGCGYELDSQTWIHIYYERISALVTDDSDAKSIFIGGDYQLSPQVGIDCDLGFGLTEGSPEISVTLGAGVKF
jgi:hypothetical protein